MINYTYFIVSILLMVLLFIAYPRFKTGLYFVSLLTAVSYILWRFGTIPTEGANLFIGIFLLTAEIISLVQFLSFLFISSRKKKELKKIESENYFPTVDIFIPTYGEPTYILKKTIAACIAIDYPKDKKKIYICDDSKRYEVKKLCEEMKVNYSIRSNNENAKSGNINNVLLNSSGEIVVVFDADMIPKNNFLKETINYFINEQVGFIQTPQSFYNPDIFQQHLSKNIPSEQDFFMRDVQQKRSYIDADIHVGTNALFRRKALDAIGGYPTFSITEDIALGLLIQAKGYESVYLNEALALGLNPTNLKDFLSQRDRWCRGNLQLLKNKRVLKGDSLSPSQKIAYFDGLLSWYSSILKMVFMVAPMFFLLTGIFFIDASIDELLSMFLPYYIGQYFVFSISSPNTRTMFWAHLYEMIMAPYNSFSCFKNNNKKKNSAFAVTNKDIKNINNKNYLKYSWPHILLISITVLSWIVGFNAYLDGKYDYDVFIINFVWTLYNAVPMVVVIYISCNKDFNFESEAKLKEENCLISKDNEYYELYAISDSHIVLKQKEDSIVLKGEMVKLECEKGQVEGIVESAINGFIRVKVHDMTTDAYLYLMKMYANDITPFYDLEKNIKRRRA